MSTLKHRWSLGHNYLAGITLGKWLRLLYENHFRVSPAYWHRAAFVTAASLVNSGFALAEQLRFGASIERVQITRPPLFILGHWRSGTTLLHELLARDDAQFRFANTYQVVNPYTFLTTESIATRWCSRLVPPQRPMDNMALSLTGPQEDEFAPLLMTLYSLYLGISFPQHTGRYAKYLTFRDVPDAEVKQWQNAFLLFCKKLSLGDSRSLLLKSPAHTARIPLLLELFPDARFIHIHRDPYRVFQSQRHFFDTTAWYTYLQRPDVAKIDDQILARYESMYEAFFHDQPSIPQQNYGEVRFDMLELDPVGEVARLYDELSLPGYDMFEPKLRAYVASLSGYKKNVFPELSPATKAIVARRWQRNFAAGGYQA